MKAKHANAVDISADVALSSLDPAKTEDWRRRVRPRGYQMGTTNRKRASSPMRDEMMQYEATSATETHEIDSHIERK